MSAYDVTRVETLSKAIEDLFEVDMKVGLRSDSEAIRRVRMVLWTEYSERIAAAPIGATIPSPHDPDLIRVDAAGLMTEDAGPLKETWCDCGVDPLAAGDSFLFRRVGGGHGYGCQSCRGIAQVG